MRPLIQDYSELANVKRLVVSCWAGGLLRSIWRYLDAVMQAESYLRRAAKPSQFDSQVVMASAGKQIGLMLCQHRIELSSVRLSIPSSFNWLEYDGPFAARGWLSHRTDSRAGLANCDFGLL